MCLFCDIIESKIPSAKVYEDGDVLAILDISQVTKGHTLVMPKKHYDTLVDVDEFTTNKMVKVAKMIAQRQMERLNAKGFNILNNGHEAAGQTIMHAHIHIIPRYDENDAIELKFNESEKQDLNKVAEELR